MKEYFTGDTIPINAILKTNGVPVDLSAAGLVVSCAILDTKRTKIVGPVSLSVFGDPLDGNVVGKIPSSATKTIVKIPEKTYIEIETNDNGDITTYGQEEVHFTLSPVLTAP